MTDEATDNLLPFDGDAYDPGAPKKSVPAVLGDDPFPYDGRGLTLPQFEAHVLSYDFGRVPPDFVVFHHTAVPDASWAPYTGNVATQWDRGEAGLSDDEIRIKRKRQLDGLQKYYASLGWNAGPHLFVDDRFIWLMTPMYYIGIHAKWGNSFRAFQRLHYSIGIEVIGYYGKVTWPPAVSLLVGRAVRALQKRLGTFDLKYLYPVAKPGMVVVGDTQRCAHPERLRYGGLSSHRDYNKPQCPGDAITEDFYTGVCKG